MGVDVGWSKNGFILSLNSTGQVLLNLDLQQTHANLFKALCSYFWWFLYFGFKTPDQNQW